MKERQTGMSWRIGDSWVTVRARGCGIGSSKESSREDAQRYCSGCGEIRTADCGSINCDLQGVQR